MRREVLNIVGWMSEWLTEQRGDRHTLSDPVTTSVQQFTSRHRSGNLFFFFNAQGLGFRNSSGTQQKGLVSALLCLRPQLERLKSWGPESSAWWLWAGASGQGWEGLLCVAWASSQHGSPRLVTDFFCSLGHQK